MSKVLYLSDLDKNINIKSEEQEVFIDYTDLYSDDYEKILKHLRPIIIN